MSDDDRSQDPTSSTTPDSTAEQPGKSGSIAVSVPSTEPGQSEPKTTSPTRIGAKLWQYTFVEHFLFPIAVLAVGAAIVGYIRLERSVTQLNSDMQQGKIDLAALKNENIADIKKDLIATQLGAAKHYLKDDAETQHRDIRKVVSDTAQKIRQEMATQTDDRIKKMEAVARFDKLENIIADNKTDAVEEYKNIRKEMAVGTDDRIKKMEAVALIDKVDKKIDDHKKDIVNEFTKVRLEIANMTADRIKKGEAVMMLDKLEKKVVANTKLLTELDKKLVVLMQSRVNPLEK